MKYFIGSVCGHLLLIVIFCIYGSYTDQKVNQQVGDGKAEGGSGPSTYEVAIEFQTSASATIAAPAAQTTSQPELQPKTEPTPEKTPPIKEPPIKEAEKPAEQLNLKKKKEQLKEKIKKDNQKKEKDIAKINKNRKNQKEESKNTKNPSRSGNNESTSGNSNGKNNYNSTENNNPEKNNGKGIGSGSGNGVGAGIGTGLAQSEAAMAATIGEIQTKIMAHWFPPMEFIARKDIVIEVEIKLDAEGNIISYVLLNPQNTEAYKAVAATVLRTLNDPRVSPLPVGNHKRLRNIVLKFCPRDLI